MVLPRLGGGITRKETIHGPIVYYMILFPRSWTRWRGWLRLLPRSAGNELSGHGCADFITYLLSFRKWLEKSIYGLDAAFGTFRPVEYRTFQGNYHVIRKSAYRSGHVFPSFLKSLGATCYLMQTTAVGIGQLGSGNIRTSNQADRKVRPRFKLGNR